MGMKVYLSGDVVVVDKTGNPILNIPQDRSKYVIEGDDITIFDILLSDEQRTNVITGVQDSGGTPIGNTNDVIKYLTDFIPRGDFADEPENTPVDIKDPAPDADGSLPVSQKTILGNYVMDKHELPYLLDRRQTGTQVWTNGRVAMSVGVGQYAVCQSFQSHPYFAGKAQTIELTFDAFDIEANVTKRIGYFDSSRVAPYTASFDGFYLEMDGTTYNLVIKNALAATTITIPQYDWDNQSTPLDLSKFNIMKLDFLYLGGSALRLFFYVDDTFVLFHTYTHAGESTGTIVSSPTLPIRWEIRSSTGTGSMGQICADVTTSGQVALIGTQTTTPTSLNRVNANVAGTRYMLKAIRLSPTIGLSKSLLNLAASTMSATNDDIHMSVIMNPSVAGPALTWIEMQDETGQDLGIQYAEPDIVGNASVTVVTGGQLIWGAYMGNQTRELSPEGIGLNRKPGISLDLVPDILVLCGQPLPTGSNADLYGVLTVSIN
jgi:hypothetical protein